MLTGRAGGATPQVHNHQLNIVQSSITCECSILLLEKDFSSSLVFSMSIVQLEPPFF
jgi:hypothetical protein